MSKVTCPYCTKSAEFMESSATLYAGRDYGPVYVCMPCEAWVGCHKGTTKPLGRLANRELRTWKIRAHRAFDPLWRELKMGRSGAYKMLAARMGIPKKKCHIGMFDIDQCRQAIEICRDITGKLR